ncbi:DUF5719 family protein [Luteococcus sp. Sow4_B9]|uniref:DUF5719 family protein n=1 Tax=Luteococcus sp. Sow4_B9 TaxID=3438792 RepID=UPI003F9C1F4E
MTSGGTTSSGALTRAAVVGLAALGLTAAAVLLPPWSAPQATTPHDDPAPALTHAVACPPAPQGLAGAQLLAAPTDPTAAPATLSRRPLPSGDDRSAAAQVLPAAAWQPAGGVQLVGRPKAGTRWWGECRAAAQRQMVLLPDAAHSRLVLANPGRQDAVVDVDLLGPQGRIRAVGTAGVTVPAGGQRVVPLSVQVPAGKPVGVQVVAAKGRVAAWAVVNSKQGGDYLPAGPVTQQGEITAIPVSDAVQVVLANPGRERARVELSVRGTSGTFTPSGGEGVVVEPGSSTVVELDSSFAGDSGSLGFRSNREVGVAVQSSGGKDLALMAAGQARLAGQLPLPGPGRLVIANPGTEPAVVRMSGGGPSSTTIPPGSSIQVVHPAAQGEAEGGLARWTSNRPVTVALVLTDGGSSVVSSQPTEEAREQLPIQPDGSLR